MTAFAAALLAARSSLADHYVVPSGSMEPTLLVGDQILVDKRAYDLRVPFTAVSLVRMGEPARGDVVVFSPLDGGMTPLVKRLVGLPGEVVALLGGALVVDARAFPLACDAAGECETSLGGATFRFRTDGTDFGPVRVPRNHYLVLGDNRPNSRDGRFFGFVPRDHLLGRASRVLFNWTADGRGLLPLR